MSDRPTTEANIDALLPTNGLGQITAVDVADACKEVVEFADTNQTAYTPLSGDATATINNQVVAIDDSGGDVTLTLLPAATAAQRQLTIKKMSASNNTIVQADGAETIDGANTATLGIQYESITIYSTGTEWIVL